MHPVNSFQTQLSLFYTLCTRKHKQNPKLLNCSNLPTSTTLVKDGSDMAGILVEDLLFSEDYDRYITQFHNSRLTSSQFYCDIDAIDNLGFGFKDLLVYLNLGTFLGLKNSYDSSQIKAFYCIAERQEDRVRAVCPFKNQAVILTPKI